MKLYKKAAACLLTAAMVLSMLTACGGGGGTPGKPGGNTPSTLPDPGQIVLPDIGGSAGGGEGGGEGTETKPTKTLIIDVNKSKLAKFNDQYRGFKEFYFEAQNVRYGDGNSVTLSIDARFARNGDAFYANRRITLGKNQQLSDEDLTLKEGKFYNGYRLLRDSKVAVRRTSDPIEDDAYDPSLDSIITSELPDLMWSTKVKVGLPEYYAEVYNIGDYEHTICFTTDGKPVYQFERQLSTKQLVSASLYKTIQAGRGTSKGLCEMPSDFKTYTFNKPAYTLTDATGNVFTLKPKKENGSVTPDSFEVLDQTGKVVTDNFTWVRDFLETKP